ncbi:hypothetical protein JG536_08240 [Burkholderia ambifaria]|uniref:hypothetical protein n=1 Tax=Burkholderia ambifaria TaxID=152480 RepID=UPI00158E69B1|nr:hypothetical protein [Burkholderia ambifaria]QQJ95634.1 hypothetical protein JG536_08240 [Burkholderia ambifaria]
MTVSDEIVLSMTAIMTAFAPGENRSMLNQPFPNGKACTAENRQNAAPPFRAGKCARAMRKPDARLASAATRRLGGHQDRKAESRNAALRATRRSRIGQSGRRY